MLATASGSYLLRLSLAWWGSVRVSFELVSFFSLVPTRSLYYPFLTIFSYYQPTLASGGGDIGQKTIKKKPNKLVTSYILNTECCLTGNFRICCCCVSIPPHFRTKQECKKYRGMVEATATTTTTMVEVTAEVGASFARCCPRGSSSGW